MTKKTGTPDELAKVWGELNAYRVLLYDLYRKMLAESDTPDDPAEIRNRSYRSIDEIEFPSEHEDTRSAAKAALDQFWHDFEGALREAKG